MDDRRRTRRPPPRRREPPRRLDNPTRRLRRRAFEIPRIQREHVKRTGDGSHYRLRVPEGKDTADGVGKPRDAYLSADVEADIHRYQNAEEIWPTERLVDLTERGVRESSNAPRSALPRRPVTSTSATSRATTSADGSHSAFSPIAR